MGCPVHLCTSGLQDGHVFSARGRCGVEEAAAAKEDHVERGIAGVSAGRRWVGDDGAADAARVDVGPWWLRGGMGVMLVTCL